MNIVEGYFDAIYDNNHVVSYPILYDTDALNTISDKDVWQSLLSVIIKGVVRGKSYNDGYFYFNFDDVQADNHSVVVYDKVPYIIYLNNDGGHYSFDVNGQIANDGSLPTEVSKIVSALNWYATTSGLGFYDSGTNLYLDIFNSQSRIDIDTNIGTMPSSDIIQTLLQQTTAFMPFGLVGGILVPTFAPFGFYDYQTSVLEVGFMLKFDGIDLIDVVYPS